MGKTMRMGHNFGAGGKVASTIKYARGGPVSQFVAPGPAAGTPRPPKGMKGNVPGVPNVTVPKTKAPPVLGFAKGGSPPPRGRPAGPPPARGAGPPPRRGGPMGPPAGALAAAMRRGPPVLPAGGPPMGGPPMGGGGPPMGGGGPPMGGGPSMGPPPGMPPGAFKNGGSTGAPEYSSGPETGARGSTFRHGKVFKRGGKTR